MTPSETAKVVADTVRLEVLSGSRVVESLLWSEVWKVEALKIDQYVTDTVAARFLSQNGDVLAHVSEDYEGGPELLGTLHCYIPGIDPLWLPTIYLPPFARNFTIIFDRGSS